MGLQATNAGIDFQQRVSAYMMILMEFDMDISLALQVNKSNTIKEINFEDCESIDDLVITLDSGKKIYFQMKRTISLSDDSESEFFGVCEQFVNQFLKQNENDLAYILVTRTEASKAISVKLKRILEGIRLANSLSVIEKLYQEERKIFDKVSSKSTHNRRERPVYGHCGWSRGRFYYRITTFEGRPWDARDPHKTTFMALKHAIRLSIWRKQKETPGVEKAPGVSSPQRKGYGELRFGVRPGHPRKAVTSISQAEALAHGLTHLHHLVFAAVLARELDWCAALQDAREDARPWGVVGIGLRSDVWVEVRRDDHRPAVLVTRVDDVVDMPHDVIGAAVRPQVVDDEEVILEEARLRVLALVERHRLDVGHDVLHAGLQRGEPEVDDPVGDCRGIERLTCAHLSPEEQPIHVIA